MVFTQLTKEQAKEEIKKLIEEFKANYQTHKKELEANTETKLVEPLFEILGWTKKDFVKQEKAHRGGKSGHADYAFYIGDKIVFFLEVKKVGVYLEKEADKQVISYALSKRVPFAVSTNFEQMKIFCVEQEDAIKNKFRVFNSPNDYINNFEDFLFLSKESFEQGITLKKAESEGRLKRRVSIDKTLLEDLMHIRKLISDDIEKRYIGKYQINEKDEIVQRIIDRLIFIRRCEDIGINPDDIKLEELRHLPQNKTYPRLKEIFKKYNDVYNSGLFAIAKDNDCDVIAIDGAIIQKLAYYLYESKDKEYIYNFDWIDADVLGQVYEQYLGKILAQTKSGRAKLKNGQAHRKEQGIYYTPTYIVDYIVKNTVGELLKDKKVDVSKIKILDPACGSGSFLIKSFDYLNNVISSSDDAKQHKLDSQGNYSIKTEILKNNIYGVDLDNKAVEITKLNLLLKAAEKGRKLPKEVDNHIRHGNSLIDDESIVGLNAFKWTGDFEEGTFDVVIGNPPWSSKIGSEFNSYIANKYLLSEKNLNICAAFILAGLRKVKKGGLFGFLLPKVVIKNEAYSTIRKLILSEYQIEQIVDFGQFPGVASDAICWVVRKIRKKDETKIIFFEGDIKINEQDVDQEMFSKTNIFSLRMNEEIQNLIQKISSDCEELSTIVKIKRGIELGQKANLVRCSICGSYNEANIKYYGKEEKVCKKCKHKLNLHGPITVISSQNKKDGYIKKCIAGTQLKRWEITDTYYILDNLRGIDYKEDAFSGPRILVKRISTRIEGTFTKDNVLAFNTVYSLYGVNEEELLFILGILNSRLIHFFYEQQYNIGMNLTTQVTIDYLSKVPIKKDSKIKTQIILQVNNILSLKKQLQQIGNKNTSETAKLKEEIKKTDVEIDELVYKIYGITAEEKKIIEESLK